MTQPISSLPLEADAALDEMQELLTLLTQKGHHTPQKIADTLLHYEEITERLFRLLIFYHRSRSSGWLLTTSIDDICQRMLKYLEAWYPKQTGMVGLSQEFLAVNRWLERCDQHGFG